MLGTSEILLSLYECTARKYSVCVQCTYIQHNINLTYLPSWLMRLTSSVLVWPLLSRTQSDGSYLAAVSPHSPSVAACFS